MKPLVGRESRSSRSADDLSYVHEYEHITLARALLASGSAVQQLDSWIDCSRLRNSAAGRGA